MNQCTVPGCTGTVEDGYCVVCGMSATPSPSPTGNPSGSPAGTAGSGGPAASNACTQPNCGGTLQGGYCDVCGAAAPAPAPAAEATPTTGDRASIRCGRPGCSGTFADGYCDVCGVAAPTPPSGAVGSASAGTGPSGSFARGSFSTGGVRSGSTRTGSARSSGRRGMLGAGLVEVPRVPYRDPSGAIMSNPEVAEGKRHCSNCGEKVGRSRGDRPGRTEGFCPKCGSGFSFTPKLHEGDLLGGQYQVLGCLAHGGLGWVYLAKDRNVSDRWVVLKGLLDSGDADAMAAAAAEQAFLAEVEHPNIVKIYNFVQHAGDGYIVMEYVGGQSLKDILLQRRRELGEEALPLAQAMAYALEVLQAFGYLHAQGLVYCDFKPDNVIQSEEQLRLIDLGGVRRLDDPDGAIYGTVGYQAPEIADVGPSITSDLYTVGRALAVLSFSFKGYTSTHANSLPPRAEVPLLQRFESYDRFLRRATHDDPAQRFQDAAEMADQLTGVLREVLAAEDGHERPAPSGLFGPDRLAGGLTLIGPGEGETALPAVTPAVAVAALPVPLVDGSDPAAGFLAGLTALEPEQRAAAIASARLQTPEVKLALARVRIEFGSFDEARTLLDEVEAERPGDWRIDWYHAASLLAEGRVPEAQAVFDRLYGLLPGEAAPKLALAYCLEISNARNAANQAPAPQGTPSGPPRIAAPGHAPQGAAQLYETVWRTDHAYTNAAFGLARVRLAEGDRAAAVAVLDSVPRISIRFIPAQIAAVSTSVRDRDPGDVTAAELVGAGERLAALGLDGERHDQLAAQVLEAALDWVLAGPVQSGNAQGGNAQGGALLGAPLSETPLRRRLEETYRALAHHTRDREERRLLIDSANAVRPRTLL